MGYQESAQTQSGPGTYIAFRATQDKEEGLGEAGLEFLGVGEEQEEKELRPIGSFVQQRI